MNIESFGFLTKFRWLPTGLFLGYGGLKLGSSLVMMASYRALAGLWWFHAWLLYLHVLVNVLDLGWT